MADFFVTLREQRRDAHFLWLTPARHDRISTLMQARGVGEDEYTVLASTPRDVASYLSAADAGLAFIKPCFSKLASSPTKYAEYLGCGLPLIINEGVGDSDVLITRERIGALVHDFDELEYANASAAIESHAGYPEQIRRRAREVAERLFDVRRVGVTICAPLRDRLDHTIGHVASTEALGTCAVRAVTASFVSTSASGRRRSRLDAARETGVSVIVGIPFAALSRARPDGTGRPW